MPKREKLTVWEKLLSAIVILLCMVLLAKGLSGLDPVLTGSELAYAPPIVEERLWDHRLSELGVTVIEADCAQGCWELEAAWLTEVGSWDTAPQWAKDRYPWANLGGDHHSYGMAYKLVRDNGWPVVPEEWDVAIGAGFILQWPDGAHQTVTTESQPYEWSNAILGPSGFSWQNGPGPYSWKKYGQSDVLAGIGLPYPPLPWETAQISALRGVHISYFGVWREVGPQLPTPTPMPEPTPTPTPVPGGLSFWEKCEASWQCITEVW